jgi:hypothetical protein
VTTHCGALCRYLNSAGDGNPGFRGVSMGETLGSHPRGGLPMALLDHYCR